MDELSLRAVLERAASPEPPLGHLVGNSLHAGRMLRRRRRATGAAALSAAAVVLVSAVPALTAGAEHEANRSHPAVAAPVADARTAYVATNRDTVVPISLATNTAGTPIKAAGSPFGITAAAAPNGQTVYEVGSTGVTPIDTAAKTAGPTAMLQNIQKTGFAVAPNGRTAYLGTDLGVYPMSTATNVLGKRINIPGGVAAMAITPNSQILYVVSTGYGQDLIRTVTPIQTATSTALAPIKLPVVPPYGRGDLYEIAITPNGRTAYVVDGVQDGKPYANVVYPINLATNTALAPIAIEASGLADGLVIAPGGRTAYVLSSRAVTPIDTTSNTAEPAINLPATAGYAYDIALTPNGKMIYVLTPRGVVPIRTASRTVLPMINVPNLENVTKLAITPDGKTIYAGTGIRRMRHGVQVLIAAGVVPISTATDTPGKPINLGGAPFAITFAS